MFLENKIEKLFRSAHIYEFRRDISPEFMSFHNIKISNVEIGVIEAMRLEIFKVRKEIIKLNKNKNPTEEQLYRIGDKALKRTWLTFKVDKESRKWLNEQ